MNVARSPHPGERTQIPGPAPPDRLHGHGHGPGSRALPTTADVFTPARNDIAPAMTARAMLEHEDEISVAS